MQSAVAAAARTGVVIAGPRTVPKRSFATRSFGGFFGNSSVAPGTSKRVVQKLGRSTPVLALFGTAKTEGTIYDFTVKSIDGRDVNLSQYKGKASPGKDLNLVARYKEFVELYDKYNNKGLEVIAFPCNQFGSQEPGSSGEIKSFAQRQGANFPLMAKTDVNGPNAEPLWDYLKKEQGGLLTSDIKWNFTKFLVDRNGKVVKRYASTTAPRAIESDVKSLL
ncbi:hypothetical protein N2152v2_010180 [Parachlorella kessleri]